MAYIQVDQSLGTHRKTLRLARLLAMDRYAVAGRLVALWSWCLDNAPRGCLEDVDAPMLADVMGYPGSPSDLEGALLAAGFLDIDGDGNLRVHGWDETMLPYIERKEKNAARMREARAQAKDQAKDRIEDGGAVCNERALHVQRTSSARADVEERRGEERRSTVDTDGEDSLRENNVAAHAPALTLGALALSPSPAASHQALPSRSPSPATAPAARVVPLAPVSAKVARAPDLLWEACVAACGGVAPSNKVERGKWNKGLAALRESGATPEEIALRATRYKRRYGEQIALNPMALAGNWTTLATEVTDAHANSAYSAQSRSSGNYPRSGAGGSGGPRGTYGAYTGQHLPDAEEWREWARRERAAGRTIIGG